MAPDPSSLTALRAKHLKQVADEYLRQKNFRAAWEGYTDVLCLGSSSMSTCKVLCNRSQAYAGALRFHEALQDACSAVAVSSAWAKAHWRKGVALRGLKRFPEAVQAFHQAAVLLKGDKECERALWAAIQRLTLEQLGQSILDLLSKSISQAGVAVKDVEEATDAEKLEACYAVLRLEHKGKPRPGPYYRRYQVWLQSGICGPEALVLRANIHRCARCYLQAREDAKAAVTLLLAAPQRRLVCCEVPHQEQLGLAHAALGDAYMAEHQHADKDCSQALRAYMQGLEADASSSGLIDKRTEAESGLSSEQIEAVMASLYGAGRSALVSGSCALGAAAQPTFVVNMSLKFPQTQGGSLSAAARDTLRRALAILAGQKISQVAIESVSRAKTGPGITMALSVAMGVDVLAAQSLVAALLETGHATIGGNTLEELLGPLDASCTEAAVQGSSIPGSSVQAPADSGSSSDQEKSIVPAARPKLEMELPYRMYRLTRADGSVCERIEKHPFAMSRIYYDGKEKPEEVWAELADGSCRWRQTGSEIKVICLQVPAEVEARDLEVSLQPFNIRVAHKRTSKVYLEGELERGIVPLESAWMHGRGSGEDACLLMLQKMNLEVLQKHWMHSESWWPRLFRHHSNIAWDDYEKDYSDLPEQVLLPHKVAEVERDAVRHLENADKDAREALQERDDLRKRTRQERLYAMRFSSFKSQLERERHAIAIQ